MKLKIFAVYDIAVGAYMQPFFLQSRGQALRAWLDTCSDPKTNMWAHPADYTLFEIGEYDESEGILTSYSVKTSLGSALEMRSKLPSQQTLPLRDVTEADVKAEEPAAMDGLSPTGAATLTSIKKNLSDKTKERSVN